MIGLDRLQQISTHLDRASNEDENLLPNLRTYLTAVYEAEEYQSWLRHDQYRGERSFNGRPPEPLEASQRFPQLKHLLTEHALVTGGRLQVKVDSHFDRIHITDGFWVPPMDRVYPTCDESEIICRYVNENIPATEDLFLIDPACGSGHHTLGLKHKFKRRSSFDISGRAIAFARFNSILNGDSKHLVGYGDIRDGICEEVIAPRDSHVVFTINMPFAIPPDRPKKGKGAPRFSFTQDGGDRGAELTEAALLAVQQFADRDPNYAKLDAVVLCYSLGRQKSGGGWSWEIADGAASLFAGRTVDFVLLEDETLWRVNGKKEQPNPMPIENLALKADCILTFSDSIRDAKRAAYRERSAEFRAAGWTHLGYGIVHVSARR